MLLRDSQHLILLQAQMPCIMISGPVLLKFALNSTPRTTPAVAAAAATQ
jgi:hypothetical protein